MAKKINLVAEITDSDLTLEVVYPKGTDPELATATNEELTEVFKKFVELSED